MQAKIVIVPYATSKIVAWLRQNWILKLKYDDFWKVWCFFLGLFSVIFISRLFAIVCNYLYPSWIIYEVHSIKIN